MSNKYSIGGYRIAVQARTSKTILLEGKDDKELFDCLRLAWPNISNYSIDTQSIIDDHQLAGLGAKARIDYIVSQIPDTSIFKSRLFCFVDREWEELVDMASLSPLPWSAPILTDIRFKTSGHSIENYGFDVEFVVEYLKHFGQSVATTELLSEIGKAVPELLKAAAAFSEVVRRRQLITKCSNIFEINDVKWNGSIVTLSSNIESRIAACGSQSWANLIEEFDIEYSNKWSNPPFNGEAYLHAHGHLGEMILWFGVGQIVINTGASKEIGIEIAIGRRDEKRRVWHKWLSSLTRAALTPIDQVLS